MYHKNQNMHIVIQEHRFNLLVIFYLDISYLFWN